MAKQKTLIGKDVIESLTSGMYDDARIIYREYIQNAADQIDKSVELGQLNDISEGKVEVEIDPVKRRICISDNATGISKSDVEPILMNIAQSTKDRSKNKGFRGIGRLGGLGYCDTLHFETSFKGEDVKSTLTWNAKLLKNIINDRNTREEAADVISKVTFYSTQKEDENSSYFRVILENVSNDQLLDEKDINIYLSMVAPVAYPKAFLFKNQVIDKAETLGYPIECYPIFINNHHEAVKKYSSTIYKGEPTNKEKIDEIYSIDFFEIHDKKNSLLAWGWYSISNFTKQMPKVNVARGIRLRKGNIQIGTEDCFVRLFKEPRGTLYFFGEVHAVSPDLIPNARRDYLSENHALNSLEFGLKKVFDDLHSLYYFSSKVRNEKKKIDDLKNFKKEFEERINKKGFSDNKQRIKYEEDFEAKKERALKAEEELSKISKKVTSENNAVEGKVFNRIIESPELEVEKLEISSNSENSKTIYSTDDMNLPRKEKKMMSRVFSVIDQILVPGLAENLKEKIKEEFKN